MKNVSFAGDIVPAICQCHPGHFIARVFLISIDQTEKQIAHTMFKDESEAEKHLDGFVFAVAQDHLKTMGLLVDDAKSITVVRGDEAFQQLRKASNQSNPNLH